jgi:hypothetical protein
VGIIKAPGRLLPHQNTGWLAFYACLRTFSFDKEIAMRKAKAVSRGLAGALAIGAGSSAYGAVVVTSVPSNLVPAALPQTADLVADWDINGDSVPDFEFRFRQPQTAVDWQARVFPLSTGSFTFGTVGFTSTFFYAWRFNAGDSIGPVPPAGAVPVGAAGSEAILGSRYGSTDYGQFLPPNSRGFLGLEFTVGANTFFGYIQVQVNRSPGAGQPGFQFISAAYENTPNTAITAGAVPEPGTLALLAFGAAGVVALQRRRKQPKGD